MIGAFSLLIIAYFRKENTGYVLPAERAVEDPTGSFKVNPLQAIVPILPVVILVLGNMNIVPALKPLQISHAMIIGVFCAFAVTRVNPAKISKEFWHGVGDSFGHVFGIIICALVFVGGLQSVGLIKALINFMISNPAIAKVSGPVLLFWAL